VYQCLVKLIAPCCTIVPTYRSKKIFGRQSDQYGTSFYKAFRKSYINVAASYSRDKFFPAWNLLADYYKNMSKGLELRQGYNYRTYYEGLSNHMGILGLSYEKKRMRFLYNLYQPFDQRLSHQLSVRRALNASSDYLQISYTYGRDSNMTNVDNSPGQVSTYRTEYKKSIRRNLQLVIAVALSDLSFENQTRLYLGYGVGLRMDIK